MTRTDRFDLPATLGTAPPMPAEAATDVGLDLDGDGSLYYPANTAPLWRALAAVALVGACMVGAVWGPEWLLQALGAP